MNLTGDLAQLSDAIRPEIAVYAWRHGLTPPPPPPRPPELGQLGRQPVGRLWWCQSPSAELRIVLEQPMPMQAGDFL